MAGFNALIAGTLGFIALLNIVRLGMVANEFNEFFDADFGDTVISNFIAGNNGLNGDVTSDALVASLITFGAAFMGLLHLKQGIMATKFGALAATLVSVVLEWVALGYTAKAFDVDNDCGQGAGTTSTVLCLTDETKTIGALTIVIAILQVITAYELWAAPAEAEPADAENSESGKIVAVSAASAIIHFAGLIMASRMLDDENEERGTWAREYNEASTDMAFVLLIASAVGMMASALAFVHKSKHVAATKHAALGSGVLTLVFYAVAAGYGVKQFELTGQNDCDDDGNCDLLASLPKAAVVFVFLGIAAQAAFILIITNSGPSDRQDGGSTLVVIVAAVSFVLVLIRAALAADRKNAEYDDQNGEFFTKLSLADLLAYQSVLTFAVPATFAASFLGFFQFKNNTVGSTAVTMAFSFIALGAEIMSSGLFLKAFSIDTGTDCALVKFNPMAGQCGDVDSKIQAVGALTIIQLVLMIVYLVVVQQSNPKATA